MKPDNDLIGYKKFLGKGRKFLPGVIIRKNGQLCFNAGAVNKFELAFFKYAILFISDSENRAAVKFTNNEKESGLIKIQSRPGNFAISCRSFLHRYNVDYSETRTLEFTWMDRSKTAFFRIKDEKDQ